MTTLAARPVTDDDYDLLSELTDTQSPLGKLHADDFRKACEAVADRDGWVNPNDVSAHLHARFGEIGYRAYSGHWSWSCGSGPNAFMDTHRDVLVPIDGKHSKGNANKSLPMRKLRAGR